MGCIHKHALRHVSGCQDGAPDAEASDSGSRWEVGHEEGKFERRGAGERELEFDLELDWDSDLDLDLELELELESELELELES